MKRLAPPALAVVLMLATACGYHVSGHADLLPSTLKTIAVPAFTNLTTLTLPLKSPAQPLQPVPFTDRTSSVFALDNHLRTAYYQNFSVGLTHVMKGDTVVDVRWVGNRGVKLVNRRTSTK